MALTGDFLDATHKVALGDAGLSLFEGVPFVETHFLTDQAPRHDDPASRERLYSLEVAPEQIEGVNGLIVLRPRVRSRVFERGADDLIVIGRSGAGYDKIDVAACTANDVALFNAPTALNHSTASAALLLMLALSKRLMPQVDIARRGRWDLQARVTGNELQGRTLGIIGLGRSGRELARLVAPFEMRLFAYSPRAEASEAEALGVILMPLEAVLRESDFVSIHCRLTPETRHLIGAAQLNLMKRTAFIINIARGEILDHKALVNSLREHRIAGAGLDVFEVEPLPAGDPLLSLPNVIATPHWLASTHEVWEATGRAMASGILRAARGLEPLEVVNPEVLDRPGFRAKLARFAENAAGDPDPTAEGSCLF